MAELPLERLDEGGSVDGKGGLPHLHLDILMITEDNRLSAKTLITRFNAPNYAYHTQKARF